MIWDSEVPGFGVRVMAPSKLNPGGARAFFLTYRINGRQVRHTLGPFPTWTTRQAREEAAALRLIDRGHDPTAERREAREAPTVRDLAERYRVEHLPGKAERSQVNDWRMIATRVLPGLGGRKVADIHGGDIRALHRAISASGAPVGANRVLALLSTMFSLSLQPREGERATLVSLLSAPPRSVANGFSRRPSLSPSATRWRCPTGPRRIACGF